jgi:hypothetical protein
MKKKSLPLLLAAIFFSGSALADSSYFDVIYSPEMGDMTKGVGFGIYSLNDTGFGGYFNGIFPIKPSNYSAGYYCGYYCTETKTMQAAYVGNIGVTFPLIPASFEKRGYQSVHGYIGIGYGEINGIVKTSDGTWTDKMENDKSGFNTNGGVIVAFDPLSINVGVNSMMKAIYIGIGFKTK